MNTLNPHKLAALRYACDRLIEGEALDKSALDSDMVQHAEELFGNPALIRALIECHEWLSTVTDYRATEHTAVPNVWHVIGKDWRGHPVAARTAKGLPICCATQVAAQAIADALNS